MLKFTRRINESFMIGDDVKVTILEKSGSQIRIGITAPRHVPVYREEIYARIQRGEKRPEPVPAATT